MLPAAHRMRHSTDFATTVRQGRRARAGTVVVHHRRAESADTPALVGFVVSRAVGGSVVRHQVGRRLRHVVRPLLTQLPAGSTTVLRALPDASSASFERLSTDVGRAFARLQDSV